MSDATANASPRPWRITEYDPGPQDIYDANGFRVCTMGITTSSNADAALIAEAVNERDRLAADEARYRAHNVVLRDIVRRLLPLAETTVENIRALGTARFPFLEQIKSDRLRGDINREVANADYLLRKARAAIGEGEACE